MAFKRVGVAADRARGRAVDSPSQGSPGTMHEVSSPTGRKPPELAWPRDIFVSELESMISDSRTGQADLELLLGEAFVSDTVAGRYADLGRASGSAAYDDWLSGRPNHAQIDYLSEVRDGCISVSRHNDWPYFDNDGCTGQRSPTFADAWARLVLSLARRGYFDAHAAELDHDGPIAPADLLDGLLRPALGGDHPFSALRDGCLDEPMTLRAVLALHDYVGRPRTRTQLQVPGSWRSANFSTDTGSALYRWKVNTILSTLGMSLMLVISVDGTARFTDRIDDARAALISTMLTRSRGTQHADVIHAIALFTQDNASRATKRSACITLAGVLEENRALLKNKLANKDERDLFRVANQFAIRHQNSLQQGGYDDLFLDWIFWWYLATIDLTDGLNRRGGKPPS
jgi:hypothetical protein